MNHYVYRIEETETKEFYWGVRSCECDPKDDTYMGSMIRWKPNRSNLIKTYIKTFSTRELAKEAEHIILKYYMNKKMFPLNRNYHNGKLFGESNKGVKLKPFSESHRHKISLAMKSMKGKKKKPSIESRNRMSVRAKLNTQDKNSCYNSFWINDGTINKRVKETSMFIDNGWKFGKLPKKITA